jgi:hypothetical protein
MAEKRKKEGGKSLKKKKGGKSLKKKERRR